MEILKCFGDCNIPLSRRNNDLTANSYGHQLIEFCKNNNIFILNDRFDTDSSSLTCKNSSTINYVLTTAFKFKIISAFQVLEFDALFSGAHCSISVPIDMENSRMRNAKKHSLDRTTRK